MFERFSEAARHVLVLAQDEARQLRHPALGSQHLLLGVLREDTSRGAQILHSLGVSLEEARDHVIRSSGRGTSVVRGYLPFTAEAENTLHHASRLARDLGQSYVGTEHLVLGIGEETQGFGAGMLMAFDVSRETLRQEVSKLVDRGEARPRFVAHVVRDEEIAPAEPRFVGAQLVRVLPVVARLSQDVVVASIEIYTDGLAVRFSMPAPGPPPARESSFMVSDDRKTLYQLAGGGWVGGDFVRGEWLFVPSPPHDANELRVCVPAGGETAVRL